MIALSNGRSCENRVLQKEFEYVKEAAELPNVVFHSLKYSAPIIN
ncbi:MAG: hypothetical protein ACK5M0_03710 [Bacteroidales bacterium]